MKIKIKTPEEKEELKNIKEEEIKDELDFHIIEIPDKNGEFIKFNVEPLISLSNKDIEQLSPEELDNALNLIASYRFSILNLKANVDEIYEELKDDYRKWHSEKWELIVQEAVIRRNQIKAAEGVPNSWFGSITKEEIHGLIISNELTKAEYAKKSSQLRKYNKINEILDGLIEILRDRGSQLQTIMNRRIRKPGFNIG